MINFENSCKPPKCEYSKKKGECVKPNPYTVFISHCTNLGKTFNDCKIKYYQNSDKIRSKVCDYLKLKNSNFRPLISIWIFT